MEQHKVNQLLVVDAERTLVGALNMHDSVPRQSHLSSIRS